MHYALFIGHNTSSDMFCVCGDGGGDGWEWGIDSCLVIII